MWSRCLDSTAREQHLLRAIEHLNLNYGADAQAFERLVRSDDAVDSLSDLEARVAFFEQAAKKDPLSPYVRQHYARMFRRAGRFEQALDQVRAGLELNENVRVLHHTKGDDPQTWLPQRAASEVVYGDSSKPSRRSVRCSA